MAKFIYKRSDFNGRLHVKLDVEEGDEISANQASAYALLEIKTQLEEISDRLHDLAQNVTSATNPIDRREFETGVL